jgi:hypothetical protein
MQHNRNDERIHRADDGWIFGARSVRGDLQPMVFLSSGVCRLRR